MLIIIHKFVKNIYLMGNTEQFFFKNGRGFLHNIVVSDFGGVRTFSIEDTEVNMTDKEPLSTIVLTFNDKDQENVNQMRKLANTILEMIGEKDSESIEFGKWLFHTDNGTEHYNPHTKEKSESIGYSPFDCVNDEVISVEALFKIWKATIKKTD